MTFMTPPGHPLGKTPLALAVWESAVYQNNAVMALSYRRMAARN
jgi:hypothetical protein